MKGFARRFGGMLLACLLCVSLLTACAMIGHECVDSDCAVCMLIERVLHMQVPILLLLLSGAALSLGGRWRARDGRVPGQPIFRSLFYRRTLLLD